MKKNISYISLLSVISCIAVVFLHTNGCFWRYSLQPYWKTANIIESVAYFAVPCFYMISGATLLNFRKRYTLGSYFLKRGQKTLIPFIFWSIIGVVYLATVAKTITLNELSFLDIYNGIMGTSFIGVFWFFTALFGVYLCIPLFAAVEETARKEIFSYLAVAGFCINVLVPFLKKLFLPEMSWPISVGVVSGALLFVVIGYLLNEYEMSKLLRTIIYVLGFLGLCIHLFGTHYASRAAGTVDSTYKGYIAVPCILYSVAIFVWFRYNGQKIMNIKLINKVITFLAEYTFSVYLLHWFLMDSFVRIFQIDTTRLLYRVGAPFIIVAAAVLIALPIKKIPIIKHILP